MATTPVTGSINQTEMLFYEPELSRQIQVERPKPKAVQRVDVGTNGRFDPCSCVRYVQYRTGNYTSVGVARNWPKDTGSPEVGGVVVTNESRAGHVGYIEFVDNEKQTFTISEYNYRSCAKSTRTLAMDDKRILGFGSGL